MDKSKPDPERVFKVLAEILSDKEDVKITVKGVKKKEIKHTA